MGARLYALIAVALAVLGAGCAVPAKLVSVRTDQILDDGLTSLENAQRRERIAMVMGTPEVQLALRDVAKGLTDGALDDLASVDRTESLNQLSAAVSRAVQAALEQGLSPEAEAKLQRALTHLTKTVTHAAAATLADEIPKTLGPALHRAIVAELSSPETREVIASQSRTVAHEAVAGSEKALTTKPNGGPSLLQRLLSLAIGIPILLGAGALALSIWIVRLRARAKRYEHMLKDHFHDGPHAAH